MPARARRRRAPAVADPLRLALLLLLAALPSVPPPAAASTPPPLHQLRAERREAIRLAAAAAVPERPALFSLLVVPVDFADARLPARWDPQTELGPRLLPASGRTLAGYWRVASRQRLDLQIVLAPTVHLPGRRIDYSDRDLGGDKIRSRRLARETIEAVAALGLDFRLLDSEGPDGRPGSPDDDGEVDGVLILHSDVGLENDPQAGFIEALQYWLLEPVVSRGTAARFYATASLRSGLGVWAHEVGHLLGLEDRYDVHLPSAGESAPRGGLGVFSLMAAGAFGSGAALDPSLLDAYSASQLGWLQTRPLRGDGAGADTILAAPAGGTAYRVWTEGRAGPEYFLLESRGGPAAGPFDAAVPAGQLVIYHVDESLPEGQASAATWPRHLRVRLVEADGDEAVARGLSPGGAADVFPGTLGVDSLVPGGSPPSDGYGGPSGIRLTAIEPVPGGVALRVRDREGPAAGLAFVFAGSEPRSLELAVAELGDPWAELTAAVRVAGGAAWGSFAGGALEVSLPLRRGPDAAWRPLEAPRWELDPAAPAGAVTSFTVTLTAPGWRAEFARRWIWRPAAAPLAFEAGLPPEWEVLDLAGRPTTTWHHWPGGGGATSDGSPVLACTGAAYTDGASWPGVAHAGGADVVLVTGALPAGTAAVRLLHHWHADAPVPGVGRDGGVLELELADGSIVPLAPLEGYAGRVDPAARAALHGRSAFVGADPLAAGRPLAWRLDVVPLPPTAGPSRLRLRFASDPFDAGRGWLVADLAAVAPPARGAAFPVAFAGAGAGRRLVWEWPWQEAWGGAAAWRIERSADGGGSWQTAWAGADAPAAAGWPQSAPVAPLLPGGPGARVLLRVVAETAIGPVASRPLAAETDGGPDLALIGPPYPNPATGEVRMLLDLPPDTPAELRLLDLRGRVVRSWRLEAGRRLWAWDGRDGSGRRVAAGAYLLRLDAGGRSATRKVVFR